MNNKYDVIVIDPPWQNKSAKRGSKYAWLDFNDIQKMPLDDLASENCLYLIWVTNKLKVVDFVENDLFSSLGAQKLATWYWLKLTTTFEPVYPLNSLHKRPYESVILACNCSKSGRLCNHNDIPKQLMISSVICSIHSSKPPLDDILRYFLPRKYNEMKRLEMFARNLLSGWTSWGNQVLLNQNINCFKVT